MKCSNTTQYTNPLNRSEPWNEHLFGGADKVFLATGGTGDKIRAKKNFISWLQARSNNDIIVYTDGSQEMDQAGMPVGVGAAWVLSWKNQWLGINGFSLGDKAEVYYAEALAACGGLEAAMTSPMRTTAQGIHICLENLSVA